MCNLSSHQLRFWRCKAVQNTFDWAILIFQAPCKNFVFFQNINDSLLKNSVLGAVSCGSQDKDKPLGHRNLRRPRGIGKKKIKIGKIGSFCKVLEKIGIAQTNIFCTALLGSFDSVMSIRLSVHPLGNMLMKRHIYIYPYVRPAKDFCSTSGLKGVHWTVQCYKTSWGWAVPKTL